MRKAPIDYLKGKKLMIKYIKVSFIRCFNPYFCYLCFFLSVSWAVLIDLESCLILVDIKFL